MSVNFYFIWKKHSLKSSSYVNNSVISHLGKKDSVKNQLVCVLWFPAIKYWFCNKSNTSLPKQVNFLQIIHILESIYFQIGVKLLHFKRFPFFISTVPDDVSKYIVCNFRIIFMLSNLYQQNNIRKPKDLIDNYSKGCYIHLLNCSII